MRRPPASSPARPTPVDEALARAGQALQARRPDEAERLAGEVLRSNRTNTRAAQLLGQALLMQDRAAEAIEPLQRAARHTEDPATDVLLARALAGAGRGAEATDRLRLAITRRPPLAQAFLDLGGRLGKAGRADEGVAVLEAGLALMPGTAVLQIGLGWLHLERQDRPRAREMFATALATAPERHDALVALGALVVQEGDLAGGADLYARALRVRPDDALTRVNLARCLLDLGRRDAGEEALRAAVRRAPALAGRAIKALADSPHGRLFLSPSAASTFLGFARPPTGPRPTGSAP